MEGFRACLSSTSQSRFRCRFLCCGNEVSVTFCCLIRVTNLTQFFSSTALRRLETCLRGVDSGDGGTDGVCYPGTNVGIQRLVRDGEMGVGGGGGKRLYTYR